MSGHIPVEFKKGDRVRYIPRPQLVGTIIRRYRGRDQMLVQWDGGRALEAHTANLLLIETPKEAANGR